MDRRSALTVLGALVGYIHGTPISGQQAPAIFLALDGVEAIVVRRRGVQAVINPDELMAALAPTAPAFQQYKRD